MKCFWYNVNDSCDIDENDDAKSIIDECYSNLGKIFSITIMSKDKVLTQYSAVMYCQIAHGVFKFINITRPDYGNRILDDNTYITSVINTNKDIILA